MKPGAKRIIAGAVFLLSGVLILPLFMIALMNDGDAMEVRFRAPGATQVNVTNVGRYYLWNQYRTTHDGKVYNKSETLPDGVQIEIRDANGRTLPFMGDMSMSMSVGDDAKKSVGYVDVEQPGALEIQISGGNEERIFTFARSEMLKFFGLLFGGIGLFFVLGLVGVALIIWGVVKRATHKSGPPHTP